MKIYPPHVCIRVYTGILRSLGERQRVDISTKEIRGFPFEGDIYIYIYITRSPDTDFSLPRESRERRLFSVGNTRYTIASVLDLSSVDLWIATSSFLSRGSFLRAVSRGSSASSRRTTRSEKSGCSREETEKTELCVIATRVFFIFHSPFPYTWHRWKKIAGRRCSSREKSQTKARWWLNGAKSSSDLRETWLSIIRIDMEWKVLVRLMINGKSCAISKER